MTEQLDMMDASWHVKFLRDWIDKWKEELKFQRA